MAYNNLSIRPLWLVFSIIVSILLGVVLPLRAFAADVQIKDKSFCAANSVNYVSCGDETTCSNSPTATGATVASSDGSSTPGLTAQQAAFVDQYHDIAEKLSIEYGIPWEAVMAQGILESGAGSSDFARNRNNFFGINAVDNNPGQATTFATPEDGWRGYYDFIADNRRYREQGVFSGSNVTDPYEYIKTIKAAGYATDPDYVAKNSAFIKAIQARAQEKGWKSSADLAKDHPEMLDNATANAQGAKPNGAAATGGSGGADCSGSSGAASGSIADVAKKMGAWGAEYQACYSGGGHGTTEELKAAIDNHFSSGYGVDCSGFVRAVIYQATGSDPGSYDTNRMCADTSKFEHIPRSQAQPGDFAISCTTHVEVITGVNSDGSFSTVGSHSTGCGEGNGASPSNYQGTESYVLRYKG